MFGYEILNGLLTNLIYDMAIMPLLRGPDADIEIGMLPAELEATIRRSAASLSARLEEVPLTEEEWAVVFGDGELRAAIRLLFVSRVDSGAVDLEDVRWIFGSCFQRVASRVRALKRVDPDVLYDDLLREAAEVLDVAMDKEAVSAANALAELRHKMVMAELKALRNMLTDRDGYVAEQTLSDCQDRLRAEVHARSAVIDLPTVVRHEPVPIDALYVAPELGHADSAKSIAPIPTGVSSYSRTRMGYARFLNSTRRRVLLGNPGAGKSTLAVKICHDLAGADGMELRGRTVTPFRIELRDFHASGLGLLPYCDEQLASHLMLGTPPRTFAALLQRRSMFIIFDGLDEILEVGERRAMRTTIETFCRQFPFADVLVSSRVVGYNQAPLSPSEFDAVVVEDFDEPRVAQYARNWFTVGASMRPKDAALAAGAFLGESESISDLRSSPLLLSLLCRIYHENGSIPESLPDVYRECSKLLFEVWDSSRKVRHPISFRKHLRPVLQDIAYWMYSTPALGRGVTESQAVARASRHLRRWRYLEAAQADATAEEFVEFCRGRLWVFSDQQSTSATGENLFGFTHRTFLEYFAAQYLLSIHRSSAELVAALLPHVRQREWDAVSHVALHEYASAELGGAEALSRHLMAAVRDDVDAEARAAVIETLLRCVAPLAPSESVLHDLGGLCCEAVLDPRVANASRRTLLNVLETVGHELVAVMASGLAQRCLEFLLGDGSLCERRSAAELLASLVRGPWPNSRDAACAALDRRLADAQQAARSDAVIARVLVGVAIGLDDAVRWHGMRILETRAPADLGLHLDCAPLVLRVLGRPAAHQHPDAVINLCATIGTLWPNRADGPSGNSWRTTCWRISWTAALNAFTAPGRRRNALEPIEVRRGLWMLLAVCAEANRASLPSVAPTTELQAILAIAQSRPRGASDADIAQIASDADEFRFVHDWAEGAASLAGRWSTVG